MSEARNDKPGALDAESQKRLVAHLRHELRSSLTAVIGYSEHLLEDFESGDPGSPMPIARDLEELRGIGSAILARVGQKLGAAAITSLDNAGLSSAIQDLAKSSKADMTRLAALTRELIREAEEADRYEIVPILCRIQAAGVMLDSLLEGYTEGPLSKPQYVDPIFALAAPPPKEPREQATEERHGRVLVADDNSVARDMLRHFLERRGHIVDEATSGREALELIPQNDYDIILLDLVMPDLSGLEVLDALERDGHLGTAPIIILSALDQIESVEHCIERGAHDFVLKPFNSVLFGARIRTALELKRHRDRERAYLALLKEKREREA